MKRSEAMQTAFMRPQTFSEKKRQTVTVRTNLYSLIDAVSSTVKHRDEVTRVVLYMLDTGKARFIRRA
jgi:hypothetical protein